MKTSTFLMSSMLNRLNWEIQATVEVSKMHAYLRLMISKSLVYLPYLYNSTSTSLTIKPDLKHSPVAFQGHIYVDDWNGGCALQSIMRMDPFVFEDETQIIYLSAALFYTGLNKPRSCLWKFTIPRNFMFKFVLIDVGGSVSLSVSNGNKELPFSKYVFIFSLHFIYYQFYFCKIIDIKFCQNEMFLQRNPVFDGTTYSDIL